jgi:hypothetical protein
MAMLTLMGGLSIRFLTYIAPKKGVIDGLKPERKAFIGVCQKKSG